MDHGSVISSDLSFAKSPTHCDQVECLSPKQFASLYGLSESTVRRLVETGGIPSCQPGGKRTRILIPRNALSSPTPPPQTESTTTCAAGKLIGVERREPNRRPLRHGPTPKWLRN
jgi:excisionase family DNA binding protein